MTVKQMGVFLERKRLGGEKNFYKIELRPKSHFVAFKLEDVGEKGHTERLAGLRQNGHWDTAMWLVAKGDAKVAGDRLIITDPRAEAALEEVRVPILHEHDDVFKAQPRHHLSEKTLLKHFRQLME